MYGQGVVYSRSAKLALIGAAAVLVLSACSGRSTIGSSKNRVFFDGFYFPAKVRPVDKKTQRDEFIIEMKRVTQSLNAAGEAAHFEGTRYCVEEFGSSVIEWAQDPLTTTETRVPSNDQLTFRGTCKP